MKAYGLARRGWASPNEVDKALRWRAERRAWTTLTVVSLVEDGTLQLTTTARSVLGKDIPLVGNGVTVEHLLAHRSGIGDYLDEEVGLDHDEYLMPVPAYEFATTEDYLAVLDGHAPKFAPGERFAYCNSGYVVLALIAEHTTALPSTSSCSAASASARGCATPRSCARTSFPASNGSWLPRGQRHVEDERLPSARPRIGRRRHLLDHTDIRSLWTAFFDGKIVSHDWVAEMVRPRSGVSSKSRHYGLGFWLHASADAVLLTGKDPGGSLGSECTSRNRTSRAP